MRVSRAAFAAEATPAVVAISGFRGNNSLADDGRWGDSAANNFGTKM
jgi:hypothetical protein